MEVGRAEYIPESELEDKQTEKDLFFYAFQPITELEQIRVVGEQRCPADEGLYVGHQPDIPSRNKLRLENRIYKNGNQVLKVNAIS